MRARNQQRRTVSVGVLLAVLAVPAVCLALPNPPTSRPPGMGGGGGLGAPMGPATAAPRAATHPGEPAPNSRPAAPAAGPVSAPAQPVSQPAAAKAPAQPASQPAAAKAPAPAAAQPAPARPAALPAPAQGGAQPGPAEPAAPQPAGLPAPAQPVAQPAAAPAAPAGQPAAAPGPDQPARPGAARATAEAGVGALMAQGAAAAAALHGAVAVRDWPAAQREASDMHDVLARMAEPDLNAPALALRATRLRAIMPALDAAIARREAFRANDTAYRVVAGMLDAITAESATRGGGGGQPVVSAPPAVPPPVEHLRQGYPEVMEAHAALLQGDAVAAKAHLDAVREHLQTALRSQPGPVFARRLDDLNKRRWRVVAKLAQPAEATRLSVALTRAYAQAVHAVGQYASLGGGGGARPAAKRGASRGARSTHALRVIWRPQREGGRGLDGTPYDKRGR